MQVALLTDAETTRHDQPDRKSGAPPGDWREAFRLNVLWLAITLAVTGVALMIVLQLWRADPYVPSNQGLDNEFSLMLIKNLLQGGWIHQTQALGAPFGQELYDFPVVSADVLHLLMIKAIGLLTDDPVLVINTFYRLGFFLVAASAFVAFRLVKISLPAASVAAVLYTLLPYHFLREFLGHLTLAAYFAVPLACALMIRQLGDEPLLDLRRLRGRGREVGLRRSRTILALVICLVVGLSSVYYAVFTILLLVFAGLIRSLTVRSARPLLASVLLAGLTASSLAVALLPNLLYVQRNGQNEQAVERVAQESETYGLKIVNLLLPTPGHRVEAVDIRPQDRSGEGTEALGIVGAVGFVGLLVAVFRRLLSTRGALPHLANNLTALVLFTLLLGTVAGLSSVVAALGFVQVRAWDRLSIFVAFFALAAVALTLDHLAVRSRGSGSAGARLGLCSLVLVIGIADQTVPQFVPRYKASARTWNSDSSFFQAVEAQFGSADVFQLPIMQFPESRPVGKLSSYAHLRGYLHSDSLRWSFGGMKGRESYWQDQLLGLPGREIVPRVALAGFEALYVDRDAYPDSGDELARELSRYVQRPIVSDDRRLAVYDLRPIQRELTAALGSSQAAALGRLVTHPVRMQWDSGFDTLQYTETEGWYWAEADAELTLTNDSPGPRSMVLSSQLDLSPGASVRVEAPGQSQVFRPSKDSQRERVRLQLALKLPPGETRVRLHAEPGPRTPSEDALTRRNPLRPVGERAREEIYRVVNPRLDEGVENFADLLRPASRPFPTEGEPVPPAPPRPEAEVPPVLAAVAVLICGVVLTAVTSECKRALAERRLSQTSPRVQPTRQRSRVPLRRPRSVL